MGYSRNEQNTDQPGDFDESNATGRYGYGANPGDQSSARRYAAYDQSRDADDWRQRDAQTQRGYYQGGADRDGQGSRGDGQSGGAYGRPSQGDYRSSGQGGYGAGQRPQHDRPMGSDQYAPYGQRGDWARDRAYPQATDDQRGQDDRGFFSRAGDEVRSWFGDDDAQRRREQDQRSSDSGTFRNGEWTGAGSGWGRHDHDYHSWRQSQLDALDRDYDEYRRENQSKFHNEFSNWRTERQGQRSSLSRVNEHMEVVGSDGAHVGTVDKVRGDRIILTKNDANADGRHHSIPSRWIQSVDDKVVISKTADDAMRHWRDEERTAPDGGGTHMTGRTTSTDK